jgi:hypothetical protein
LLCSSNTEYLFFCPSMWHSLFIFYYSSTCFGLAAIFRCYSILSRSCCSVMPIFCLCHGASLVLAIFRCYSILSRSCSIMPMLPAMCSCHTAIFRCYGILSRSWCAVMRFSSICQGASHVLLPRGHLQVL